MAATARRTGSPKPRWDDRTAAALRLARGDGQRLIVERIGNPANRRIHSSPRAWPCGPSAADTWRAAGRVRRRRRVGGGSGGWPTLGGLTGRDCLAGSCAACPLYGASYKLCPSRLLQQRWYARQPHRNKEQSGVPHLFGAALDDVLNMRLAGAPAKRLSTNASQLAQTRWGNDSAAAATFTDDEPTPAQPQRPVPHFLAIKPSQSSRSCAMQPPIYTVLDTRHCAGRDNTRLS